VFHDRGVSVVSAGLLLAVTNTVAIASALVTPGIAHRLGDVRPQCLGPQRSREWACGSSSRPATHRSALGRAARRGQGATISLALMVMVLRSRNQHQAMALSGMAQGVGYLIAAIGPTLVGALYDVAHNWSLPLACSSL